MKIPEINILLIEDNPIDAALIEKSLSKNKDFFIIKKLRKAETLADGIAAMEENPCDVILLDLHLPDTTGLETVTKVGDQFPVTPVIVLTALNDFEMAVKSLRRGASDYLMKDEAIGGMLSRSIRFAIERNKRLKKHEI